MAGHTSSYLNFNNLATYSTITAPRNATKKVVRLKPLIALLMFNTAPASQPPISAPITPTPILPNNPKPFPFITISASQPTIPPTINHVNNPIKTHPLSGVIDQQLNTFFVLHIHNFEITTISNSRRNITTPGVNPLSGQPSELDFPRGI